VEHRAASNIPASGRRSQWLNSTNQVLPVTARVQADRLKPVRSVIAGCSHQLSSGSLQVTSPP